MIKNTIGLVCLTLIPVAVYGWIMNIVHLINNVEAVGLSIARGIGIFVAPLGAVLGFI